MNPSNGRRLRAAAVLAPLVMGVPALLLWGPIRQDPEYHRFADQSVLAGIPHAGDVLSNFAFLAAGVAGLAFLASPRSKRAFQDPRERTPYVLFFAGILLTALGSAWYHLAPDTDRLFWDRLPMAIAFLALLCAVLAERVSPRWSSRLIWPLLAAGLASVVYWRATERAGRGDLRPYALVQYSAIAAIVLILALYPARSSSSGFLWAAATGYGLAKVFELTDEPILRATGVLSGHTLKHVAAGAASGLIVWMLARRGGLSKTRSGR